MIRLFPTRLRARLVVVALIAIAPAVVVLALTQSAARQRARGRAIADNQRLARLAAAQQASIFDGARRLLLTLSEFPPIASDDPQACDALLPKVLAEHPGYFNLTVVDAEGNYFCGAKPVNRQLLARGRSWFERALARRGAAVGDLQTSLTTGRPAIVVAQPLVDASGRVVRVLSATIAIDQLNRLVANAELPRGAVATLFDRSGTILGRYPDGDQWVGKKVPDGTPVPELDAGAREVTAETVGVDGVRRLFVIVPLRASLDTGLYIAFGTDHATAFHDADRIFVAFLWVLGFVVIGGIAAAVVAGHLFVGKPVKALRAVTAQLAKGDLTARTQLASGMGGIGELQEALNTMASALDARQRERDRVEGELRESEDRYRLLFARNPQPMLVFDAETLAYLEVNEAAVARYGYTRDEFLAMNVTDIRPSEDVPRLIAALAARREPWDHHGEGWRHRLKSGEIIDVEVSSHSITYLGRRAVLVAVQDVTDRKLAESALLERVVVTALIADVGVALNHAADLRVCLQSCAEALVAHLDAVAARIWTVDASGSTLELVATAGDAGDCDDEVARIPVGSGGIGRIASLRRPHFTNDAVGDADVDCQAWLQRRGLRMFIGSPMVVGSRIVGVIALYGRDPLSEVTMTAAASAADLVALGIGRHHAEGSLRQSEERFRQIAATVTQVFWIADVADHKILYISPGYERIWGRSCESLYSAPRSFLDAVHPDDRGPVLRTLESQQRGVPFDHEYRIVRPDGEIRHVHDRGFPIRRADGSVVEYVGVAEDITGRLKAERAVFDAEERMRFALEASQLGVWEANLRTGAAYWSDTCQTMHGVAPGSFGDTFEAFLDRIHADDRDAVRATIEEAIRGRTDAQFDYRTTALDGTTRWIAAVGRFSYDASGAPTRGAGIASDVTERRQLEEQLRQSQKMEAVGQLAGGVAHDFNNLLTAILGFSEFLAESLPQGDARLEDVGEIRHAAERAATLTRQLLAFSRKQIFAVRVLSLGDVVGELTPMLRRVLGESIDLATIVGDRTFVKADPGQLQQVIVNLAVNAHDAMRDGGRLTIETSDVMLDEAFAHRHPSVRPGPHVKLTVTDTGHGMDAATQKRIFEPFFTTKPQGQGTGLGLATVYGIVKQSGGSIWVQSEPGRGTTFTVFLPKTEDRADAAERQAPEARTHGGAETVMLIEDELLVREYVYKVLTRHGYSVHAFADPCRAIAYAEANSAPIDLVLTDVVLPNMSGKAAVAKILEQHPESRTLFMSGYADHAIVRQGMLDEGTAFLQKPFTPAALGKKIRDVLDAVAV